MMFYKTGVTFTESTTMSRILILPPMTISENDWQSKGHEKYPALGEE